MQQRRELEATVVGQHQVTGCLEGLDRAVELVLLESRDVRQLRQRETERPLRERLQELERSQGGTYDVPTPPGGVGVVRRDIEEDDRALLTW